MILFDLAKDCRQIEKNTLSAPVVAALGNFDGVHTGHRALLDRTVEMSRIHGAVPAVWTFSAPPFPERCRYLTTLSEKLTLFREAGIRYVMLYDFPAIRDMTPEAFVSEILISECGVVGCVCGFNYRFGRGGLGTPELLRSLMEPSGGFVSVEAPVLLDGTPVSSTRIRAYLEAGDVQKAALCLGRLYTVSGPVLHGKALGRTIGVPTLNQALLPGMQTAARGTYATYVVIDDTPCPAVTNIGIRPSIAENDPHTLNAETHIIDYKGWLYGKNITVCFRYRLRDERSFASLDALKAQIDADIRQSRDTFSPK